MGIGILPITMECLESLVTFTGRGYMITKAPKDMRVLGAHVKPELNQVWLTVESPDIENTEPNKLLPFVDVTIAAIKPATDPLLIAEADKTETKAEPE